MKKAKRVVKRILKIVKLEEMRILPGQLAFFMVLSVFAIFPLLGLISSNFVSEEIISSIESTLPVAISTIFKSLLNVDVSNYSIFFFLGFLLFFASNGCNALIITSNVIYKIKNKSFLKQRLKSLFMTIVLISLILFVILVPAFGELIIHTISKNYPGKIIDTIAYGYKLLKYPISFLLIFIGIKILYTLAPDQKILSRYNNYGTLFTTILWIFITRIYAVYLKYINTYDIFYGNLANVVILLFWIYLLAYVFTMGIAINYEKYHSCQVSVKEKSNTESK